MHRRFEEMQSTMASTMGVMSGLVSEVKHLKAGGGGAESCSVAERDNDENYENDAPQKKRRQSEAGHTITVNIHDL
jgi:hypothetical protein